MDRDCTCQERSSEKHEAVLRQGIAREMREKIKVGPFAVTEGVRFTALLNEHEKMLHVLHEELARLDGKLTPLCSPKPERNVPPTTGASVSRVEDPYYLIDVLRVQNELVANAITRVTTLYNNLDI